MTDFITSFSLIKLDSKYYEIRPSLKGQWFASIEPIIKANSKGNCRGLI